MKKFITILIAALCVCYTSRACDICGCGVGNSYIGILPDFNKHIIGLRYRYNSIFTHVGIGGATTYLTTDERYRTVEAWAGWNVSRQFRLMAVIPYSFNEKENQGVTQRKEGISDVTVSALYGLINRKGNVGNRLVVQSLWVGGGLKLPTGKYNPKDKLTVNDNANLFQLGTGSVDFTFSGMYDLRVQDAGINLSANYKVNTPNKYDYSYGNKLSANAQLYYKWRVAKIVSIAPNAGLQYENARQDVDNHLTVDISGGRLLLGTVGLEMMAGRIAAGANWQTPLSQNLANGIVKANDRLMVHVAFLL